jgi:hypothetical protein
MLAEVWTRDRCGCRLGHDIFLLTELSVETRPIEDNTGWSAKHSLQCTIAPIFNASLSLEVVIDSSGLKVFVSVLADIFISRHTFILQYKRKPLPKEGLSNIH